MNLFKDAARSFGSSLLVCDDDLGHAMDHLHRLAFARVEAADRHPGDHLGRAEACEGGGGGERAPGLSGELTGSRAGAEAGAGAGA